MILTALEPLPLHRAFKHSLFLAGGIAGCPDWQSDDAEVLIFNPRRKDFPIDDPQAAETQICWEHKALREAEAILFWFPCESLCPIALYELGAWSMSKKPLFVGAHEKYRRHQDVVIQTKLARPDVQVCRRLEDVVFAAKRFMLDMPVVIRRPA